MTDDIYRQLAQRLDAIPNGFSPTESGVELRLLARIFEPQEAAVAAVMELRLEPASAIAARAGLDPRDTYRLLKTMARKGQVRAGRKGHELGFALMPFVVGIYEEQLPRMDAELASLFEAYFLESAGFMSRYEPAVHRVIPVQEAIPAGVEIYPYEQASALLEQAQAWGVRECICRLQQKLIGKGCDRPLESCLAFAPVPGAFDNSDVTRAITKEQALDILRQAAAAGLIHSPGNYRDGHFYICNCCTCCCGVLRGVAEFSLPTAIARADFVATADPALCAGCGDCVARCQFGALALVDDVCCVDSGRCVGCGQCVTVCPSGALALARRPAGEIDPLPADMFDWASRRARARGLA
ncbi:MAG TPA: 4Fe-4S binding protein [Anaerolineae bacterium]|nr:4Fe-4S binding protein [Anaerolineae bacterium]